MVKRRDWEMMEPQRHRGTESTDSLLSVLCTSVVEYPTGGMILVVFDAVAQVGQIEARLPPFGTDFDEEF